MNLEVFNEETSKWEKFDKDIFHADNWFKEHFKKEFNNVPFDWRSYNMYGFLANVRNYAESEFISCDRGIPEDSCYRDKEIEVDGYGTYIDIHSYFRDQHSVTWITVDELLKFDYEKRFYNRRDNETTSYRDFLYGSYFRDLEVLKTINENPAHVRLVFGFDN
jgi:hypothetical protein